MLEIYKRKFRRGKKSQICKKQKTCWKFFAVFSTCQTCLHFARLDRHQLFWNMLAVGDLIKLYFSIEFSKKEVCVILAQNQNSIISIWTLKRHCCKLCLFRRKRHTHSMRWLPLIIRDQRCGLALETWTQGLGLMNNLLFFLWVVTRSDELNLIPFLMHVRHYPGTIFTIICKTVRALKSICCVLNRPAGM